MEKLSEWLDLDTADRIALLAMGLDPDSPPFDTALFNWCDAKTPEGELLLRTNIPLPDSQGGFTTRFGFVLRIFPDGFVEFDNGNGVLM